MSWSVAEVETILAQMREGATAQSGGSRCHTTYFYKDGEWGYEDFDEGSVQVGRCSEARLRELIAREPELFRPILWELPWRRFVADLAELELGADSNARARVREHLREALGYGRSPDHVEILDALLAWPEEPPSHELVAMIHEKLQGFTAYHVIMDALGWRRDEASTRRGLALVERLTELLGGEAIGLHYLRSSFEQQRLDWAAARRELEAELALLPPSHRNVEYIRGVLARMPG